MNQGIVDVRALSPRLQPSVNAQSFLGVRCLAIFGTYLLSEDHFFLQFRVSKSTSLFSSMGPQYVDCSKRADAFEDYPGTAVRRFESR